MKITWDERKRLTNMKKHGFDFEKTNDVFDGLNRTTEDRRFPYSERRFKTIGLLDGEVIVLIHTGSEEHIHVISLRKATRREVNEFLRTMP